MTGRSMPFWKMNGAGNVFLIVDARHLGESGARRKMRALGRCASVAYDQLIVLHSVPAGSAGSDAGVAMLIQNSDESGATACGNASRCVGAILMDEMDVSCVRFHVGDRCIQAQRSQPDHLVWVDMGPPRTAWHEIPLTEAFHDTRMIELSVGPIDAPVLHSPSCVNMGNPHAVFWVDDLGAHQLETLGPFLEHHVLFPDGANITLARIKARNHIAIRTWERGAGLTRSCGTAACATAVSAHRIRMADRQVEISSRGGVLRVEWSADDNHVWLNGPVKTEFSGVLRLPASAERPQPAPQIHAD